MAEPNLNAGLEKAFWLIPTYLSNLLRLISGPKRFIAERLSGDQSPVENAWVFLALSVLMGWLLELPFAKFGLFWELARDGGFSVIFAIVFGGALYLAWHWVGGRAELRKFLTISFYYGGALKLMMTMLFLAIIGTMETVSPSLYTEFLTAATNGTFALFLKDHLDQIPSSSAYQWSLWVQVPGFAGMLAWLIAAWGGYRQLYKVSRMRSAAAGLLFVILCLPAAALTFVIANSLVAPPPHGVEK